ncbi:MAG: hypothetical protein ABIP35_08515, partial [Ginsengibacter sp.]
SGISKSIGWKGGGSFIYCTIKKLNEDFMEKILALKNGRDANKLLKTIMATGFISYDIDKIALEKNSPEFENLDLDTQKKLLVRLLDLNFLYVPYSEIEDKDYRVSEPDRKLNRMFYSLKIK